jgi:hypothetical protein
MPNSMKNPLLAKFQLLALILGWVFLAGCSPISRPEQIYQNSFVELGQNQEIGQTFVANFAGLTGIELYIQPGQVNSGALAVSLTDSPTSSEILSSAKIDLSSLNRTGYYLLQFPPLSQSSQNSYYLQVVTDSREGLLLGISGAESYLDGSLYQNGQPVESQLTFRLVYAPALAAAGFAREVLTWIWLIFAASLLFVLPGWGLIGFLWSGWDTRSLITRLSLSIGTSLAIYPLIFLWANLVGLQPVSSIAWLLPLLGLGLVFIQIRKQGWQLAKTRISLQKFRLTDLFLVLLISFLFFSRFWTIRTLDAPLWGDSYQHSLIVQLMLDNGGLFQSWQPYANLDTFSYHFGFHATAAVYAWFTQLTAPESVLWFGQILNVAAVLALYPLAVKVSGNKLAGVSAILIAGVLSQLPGDYVNWGRFTQLTGQTILPVCVFFAWTLFEKNELNWKHLFLNWLLAAGLALTHYRVAVFAILFIPAFWVFSVRHSNLISLTRLTILYGLGAGILFLPWLFSLVQGQILDMFGAQLSTPAADISEWDQTYNAIGSLQAYLPIYIWILSAVAAGWLLWKRVRSAVIFMIWWLFLLLAANPSWLGLPGTGAISNFALFIAAYIPAGVLIGTGITQVQHLFYPQNKTSNTTRKAGLRWIRSSVGIAAGLLLIFGTLQRMDDADPTLHALVTRPDVQAAAWINQNVAQDSRFLVNSFPAFGETSLAGSDAGWWLPLTAARQTSLEPLSASFEQDNSAASKPEIELVLSIQENGINHPNTLALMKQQQISHLYIGQRQGSINSPTPLLKLDEIHNNPSFEPIYHQDRVWIFVVHIPNDLSYTDQH